ncbi:MAG: hypothetical protein DSY91_01480 [Deltaproteobacteria bacterium]|nr:MAG: hypothetical protein DSY91_01480 [Deltaproteobacteria bacterium]
MDRRLKVFKNYLRAFIQAVFPSEPWFIILYSQAGVNETRRIFLSFPFEENFLTEKMTTYLLPKLPREMSAPVYRRDLVPDFSVSTVNVKYDITAPISYNNRQIGLFWVGTYDWHGFLTIQRKTVTHLAALIGFMLGIFAQSVMREQDLVASELRFQDLVKNLDDAVFVAENDRLVYVNPALSTLLCVPDTEILGRSLMEWIFPEELEAFKLRWQRLIYGEPFPQDYEIRLTNKKGELRQCLLSLRKMPSGKEPLFLGTLRDVTGLKTLWDGLYEAQKKEAIGTLAGGMAHDFNTILASILGYASLIKRETPPDGKLYRYADGIEQSSVRAVKLIQQLLGFSSRGRYKEIPFVLQGTLQDLREILSSMTDPPIEIILEMVHEPLMILGDMDQIHQALLNVCLNARDAMPQGGTLKITLSKRWVPDRKESLKQKLFPGVYAQVTIEDTGCGMDEAIIEKIFDPFFTTKEVGSGVGLGLSMTYGIVKSHGGFIEVESTPDVGSTFRISFPLYEAASELTEEEPAVDSVPRGQGEKILVVDDNGEMRDTVREILEGNGYRVQLAANGLEALKLYKEALPQEPFELVLLDMGMPVMGGEETYWKLRQVDPGVTVIIMTGYALDGDVRELLQSGVPGYLQKPFKIDNLLRAVRTTLDLRG